MKLYFASGNAHKHEEMSRIFHRYTLIKPEDLEEVEENATSFLGNAEIKARALFQKLPQAARFPVLADDSGLVIPALGGAPGIYSARYGCKEAGRELSAGEKNQLILKQMERFTKPEERRCFFVAALVIILEEERILSVQERFEGVIAHEPVGAGGFGYDPIVFLPKLNKSVAELSEKEKDTISHRGLAGAAIQRILEMQGIREAYTII